MITFLDGKLVAALPTQATVDVNGVGYEVFIPLSSYDKLPAAGQPVEILTHLHVREDAHILYGFMTAAERDLFRLLVNNVSGIGPKLALAVLSGIEPNELIAAVRLGDVARLTAIPGVGKKTAERIGLELKDKLGAFLPAEDNAGAPAAAGESLRTDVLSALINLGYHRPLAERSVDAVLKQSSAGSFEQTLKSALRELAR